MNACQHACMRFVISISFALVAAVAMSACEVAAQCTNDGDCSSGFECALRECVEISPPPEPPPCDLDDSETPCPDAGLVDEIEDAGDSDPCVTVTPDGGLDTGRCG